ncbi:sodium-dependent neutral amino acid transporter B(0)AT3-like isoform X2 [Dunckerocampus dactyliophorus]|nr:sodium-dependent neutral amino acid transporter B(0)AT3-like isoform X2 [Dunckerocampus dactyliophorus]XP_054619749.1 sodium-dependent neutral amino acid transporter B(0)AT3-like isoform X2 [Dunckerocampus dactyliophorus]
MDIPKELAVVEEEVKWDNKIQYLLTVVGFAVGLGNIWRFPFLCQIYGGGAFLIPYLLALVIEGIPLLYLELAVGQKLRKGSIGVWMSISPFLGGVGIGSMMVSFLIALFYNSVLAWVLWYFYNSCQSPLPWSQCLQDEPSEVAECEKSTPVNYFWYRETLNIMPDIETSGSLQWKLVICLTCAWVMLYLCFIKGIKSMGKAVYVTTPLPYLILTIFLIRALTLPGATDGLVYLFTPDWGILKDPQVWLDASTQIFFSLSVAFGGLIAFSSYNNQLNNCEKDAVMVGIINSATSLYASISVFSILGFKANNALITCREQNIKILKSTFGFEAASITTENYDDILDKIVLEFPFEMGKQNLRPCDLKTFLDQSASGTGLAFITFTEAVLEMPGSQLWAALFFLMLFSLGLSSMFGIFEGVLKSIHDLNLQPKRIPNSLFTGIVCFVSLLISLIFTLGSGNYWVGVFNSYVGSIPLLIIAFFEVVGVVYVHGMQKFTDDIFFMTGKRPNIYWRICWRYISPIMLLVVLVAYVVLEAKNQPTYGAWDPAYELFPQTEVKTYPGWVFAIIILLCVLPVISIPLVALYHLIKAYSTNPNVALYKFEMFEMPAWGRRRADQQLANV